MEFNDGSQYRVLTNVDAYLAAGREMFGYRVASARLGVPYVDTAFDHHRQVTSGLKGTVLYQFLYMNAGTPEQQANFFCSALGNGLQQHEMVMADLESGSGVPQSYGALFLDRWLAAVEAKLDCRAWIYLPSYYSAQIAPEGRVVVAPRYSGTPLKGYPPWWPYDVWQYTDQGFFPGCALPGDLSTTNLTVDQLLARCNPNGFVSPGGH